MCSVPNALKCSARWMQITCPRLLTKWQTRDLNLPNQFWHSVDISGNRGRSWNYMQKRNPFSWNLVILMVCCVLVTLQSSQESVGLFSCDRWSMFSWKYSHLNKMILKPWMKTHTKNTNIPVFSQNSFIF